MLPSANPMMVAIATAVSVTFRESATISISSGSRREICRRAAWKASERSSIGGGPGLEWGLVRPDIRPEGLQKEGEAWGCLLLESKGCIQGTFCAAVAEPASRARRKE